MPCKSSHTVLSWRPECRRGMSGRPLLLLRSTPRCVTWVCRSPLAVGTPRSSSSTRATILSSAESLSVCSVIRCLAYAGVRSLRHAACSSNSLVRTSAEAFHRRAALAPPFRPAGFLIHRSPAPTRSDVGGARSRAPPFLLAALTYAPGSRVAAALAKKLMAGAVSRPMNAIAIHPNPLRLDVR